MDVSLRVEAQPAQAGLPEAKELTLDLVLVHHPEVVAAPDVVMVATRRLIERESTVAGFVAARLQKTGSPRDHVTLKGAHAAYCAYCAGERKAPEKKGDFKDELLAESLLGGFSQPSGAKKNYWRGWAIKEADGDDEEEDAEEERDGLGE